MEVKLTYFKHSGQYYSSGNYTTRQTHLREIWNEVEAMLIQGRLPQLVPNAREFIVMVDVPEHPHNHPHLIIKDLVNGASER